MCYTVLVVKEVCYHGHVIKVTAAWRQCRPIAEKQSQETQGRIHLCEQRADPGDIAEMSEVFSQSKGDPDNVSMVPCPTCSRVEGNKRIREIKDEMERWRKSESDHRSNEEALSNAILNAPYQFQGHVLAREVKDLRERQEMMVSKLYEIQTTLGYLHAELSRLSERISNESDNNLYRIALGELNEPLKIYFGEPEEVEMEEEPDRYPLHQVKIDEEMYPFKIFEFAEDEDDDEHDVGEDGEENL